MLGSHLGIDQFMEMVDCSNMAGDFNEESKFFTTVFTFEVFLKSTVPGTRQATAYSPISNFFSGSTVPGRE